MKTLRLSRHFGGTWLRSLFSVLAFCFAAELLARTPAAGLMPVESYGSSHEHFNTQVSRILARAAHEGPIDCILLGDSQVLYDIDPAIIESRLQETQGKGARCQNFGLGGMRIITAEPLARMLIERFHPSVLILGTSEFNYIPSALDASHASIMASPWLAWELGDPSVDGWLYEYSRAYRYYQGTLEWLFNKAKPHQDILPNGRSTLFEGKSTMPVEEQFVYFRQLYGRPRLNLDNFKQVGPLLALASDETSIVVLEMPVTPAYISKYRIFATLYPEYVQRLRSEAAAAGSTLWLTQQTLQIPADGWYDLIHMDRTGSVFFSRYIADKLAPILGARKSGLP